MSTLTAIVRLDGDRLQLVRHPSNGRVIAFDDAQAAFAFAVSLEIAGAPCAGTVAIVDSDQIQVLPPSASAFDLITPTEMAA
jgi:hypothetical protein